MAWLSAIITQSTSAPQGGQEALANDPIPQGVDKRTAGSTGGYTKKSKLALVMPWRTMDVSNTSSSR